MSASSRSCSAAATCSRSSSPVACSCSSRSRASFCSCLGLCLGERALELLDVGQQALLLAGRRLRLGQGGLQALDLAAQLLELCRVGLDDERRLGGHGGLFGHVLGLGVKGFRGLIRSDLRRFGLGLDRLGLCDLRDILRLLALGRSRMGGQLGLLLDRLRLGRASACTASFVGSGPRPRGGCDGSWRQPELGRSVRVASASTSAAASSSFGGTPSAKPYSVRRAPPLCIASAWATAAPEAKPSSTMIWPSGRFDCRRTSSTVASCSSLISPSSVISSPS